jgi:diguanylate cyclase (GGDEF)-like protein
VIDAALTDVRQRLLLFAFGALAVAAVLAYVLGRPVVGALKDLSEGAAAVARGHFSRRVRVRGHDEFSRLSRAFNDMAAQLESRLEELAEERGRVRGAVNRFGEALAATHDPYALLPVIVESTVQATGAAGGRLLQDGRELARAGNFERGGRPLEIHLSPDEEHDAVLLLSPVGSDFSDEARELAHWLGRQAAVALENARLHRRVERQAVTDGLTELPNRRHFEESLVVEISRVERFGGSLALIYADLDDFKAVNDQYGHQTGDDVLRAFAAVLRRNVRDVDTPARYGGEEFAILLPNTDLDGAERLAERIRKELVERPITTLAGQLLTVTSSFGVAAFPDEPTPDALIAAADDALYQAKRSGKNCVVCARNGAPTSPAQ